LKKKSLLLFLLLTLSFSLFADGWSDLLAERIKNGTHYANMDFDAGVAIVKNLNFQSWSNGESVEYYERKMSELNLVLDHVAEGLGKFRMARESYQSVASDSISLANYPQYDSAACMDNARIMRNNASLCDDNIRSLEDYHELLIEKKEDLKEAIETARQNERAERQREEEQRAAQAESRRRTEALAQRRAESAARWNSVFSNSPVRQISQEEFRTLIMDYKNPRHDYFPRLEIYVLNFTVKKPTVILFYGKSHDESTAQLQILNTVYSEYSDKVDFLMIDNANSTEVVHFFQFYVPPCMLLIRPDRLHLPAQGNIPIEDLRNGIDLFLLPEEFTP